MAKFRVTDSTLNSYGFRVLTEGIDFSLFDKNPIMLWMHNRSFDQRDYLPIGKWENREIVGDAVLMDPIIDEKDEFAVKIKSKVDQGIVNMASISIDIIEMSSDPKYLLPGQTYPTITKSLCKEVSLVDMGSNYNAMKLFYKGHEVKLADGLDENIFPPIKTENMKSIAIKLGLPESATEDQILQKITEIQLSNTNLSAEKKTLSENLSAINDAKAVALVDGAIASNKITADKKETFLKMAKSDFEGAQAVLNAMPTQKKPTETIVPASNGQADQQDSWKNLVAGGSAAVLACRSEDPERYKKLYREEFKMDPVIE